MNRRQILSKLMIGLIFPLKIFSKASPSPLSPKTKYIWSQIIEKYQSGALTPMDTLESFIKSTITSSTILKELEKIIQNHQLTGEPFKLLKIKMPHNKKAKVQLFKMTNKMITPPHMHKGLFSCQIVLKGNVDFYEWNKKENGTEGIFLKDGKYTKCEEKDFIKTTPDYFNVHAFGSKNESYILNFNIQDPYLSPTQISLSELGRHYLKVSKNTVKSSFAISKKKSYAFYNSYSKMVKSLPPL